jgi:hypothetical protein
MGQKTIITNPDPTRNEKYNTGEDDQQQFATLHQETLKSLWPAALSCWALATVLMSSCMTTRS